MQVLHYSVSEGFVVSSWKSCWNFVYPEFYLSETVLIPTKPDKRAFCVLKRSNKFWLSWTVLISKSTVRLATVFIVLLIIIP